MDFETRLQRLADERRALESGQSRENEKRYDALQRQLGALFQEALDAQRRIEVMLEMMRILEDRLVYLQNFTIDPTSENRIFAGIVIRFIDELSREHSSVLSTLEATYYRAVAALHAGDVETARRGFGAACASEESDEANDIKYKSFVILGNLSHEDADYARARELHEQSMQYSPNENVSAQALALKALNSYALGDHDEALGLFDQALALFDESKPFFNSYFHRNALLFCGAIHFDRKDYARASEFYERVSRSVDQGSFDYFDALSHLGRICYLEGRFGEALQAFEKAVRSHHVRENEYVVDTWFWLARSHLRNNDREAARSYLLKIAKTEVRYEKKPQAMELLGKIA
jgi:tetratricopeptide (TPR) repeat protein